MRSARAQQATNNFKNILQRRLSERREAMRAVHNPGTIPEFRTVTEDMDPNTEWVIPAKEMDMTGFLMDVNRRMEDTIQEVVVYIVNSYEQEFA